MPSITDVHDSILTSKPQTKTLDIGLALDISELVLAALTTAAKLSKIPYVQDAASQALCIVKIIQVSHYFFISPSSGTDQEREDIGSQE